MRNGKRLLSLLLIALMLLASLPVAAYADPPQDDPSHRHSWKVVRTVQPTCTKKGSKAWKCARCGKTYTESIPAKGHKIKTTEGKPATCTEAGLSEGQKCTVCGTVLKKQEKIPALGHDWDDGVITTQPAGFTPGVMTYTCRHDSSHTYTEEIDPAESLFELVRGTARNPIKNPLVVTKQPEGGSIERYSGESHTMTVAVEGGEAPYTYHWYYKDKDGIVHGTMAEQLAAIGAVIDSNLVSAGDGWLKAASKNWADSHADLFKAAMAKQDNSPWHDYLADALKNTSENGDLFPGVLSPKQQEAEGGDGPTYEATKGNCEYWCEIWDNAKHHITTDTAFVSYGLRIAVQPSDTNLYGKEKVELTCVAADGSGDYTYTWIDNQDTVQGYGTVLPVYEIGDYCCLVKDNVTGESITSYGVQVYSWLPFKICSNTAGKGCWPEEKYEVWVSVMDGVEDYDVWWELNGNAIETRREGTDEHGHPKFVAIASVPGTYVAHCVDGMKETATCSSTRWERHLTISEQPKNAKLPKDSYIDLKVAVSDGDAPFHYVLYRNGHMYQEKTSNNRSESFHVWYASEYKIRIEDKNGHNATSNEVTVENAVFKVKSQTQSAEIKYPGYENELRVTVEGGKEPYTYQWGIKKNGIGFKVGTNSNKLPVTDPGTYFCRIYDSAKQDVRTKDIVVTYTGEAPFIIEHPHSGSNGATLSCKAISGKGEDVILFYQWERLETYSGEKKWVVYKSGYQSITPPPGIYRCMVFDLVTQKSTPSGSAEIKQ